MRTGRPTMLTAAQITELRAVARARAAIPANKELARRMGVSRNTIQYWLDDERQQMKAEQAAAARERQMPRHSNFDSTPRIPT